MAKASDLDGALSTLCSRFTISCLNPYQKKAALGNKWAQERMGTREGDMRGEMELSLPSRVSFSRAGFFLRPFIS